MEDDYENVKKKTGECKEALADELDTYAFSSLGLSTPGRNLKALHRKQARIIVNDYFNTSTKEINGTNLQQSVCSNPSLPNQTLPLTLPEYRKLLKKTEECKAALTDILDTYLQSLFRSSATGRNAEFLANLKTFYREQMLHFIEVYFNTEVDPPISPSNATIPSVNQFDDASNQEAVSAQVVTTPSSPPISVTPGDQQQLVNTGGVLVKEEPIEEGSSTRPREDSAVNPTESDNHTAPVVVAPPNDANVSIKSEIECKSDSEFHLEAGERELAAWIFNEINENNPEIDEANNLHNPERDQVGEMQTDAQQQATESFAVNSNNEQVDNSNANNNLENFDDSQGMDFNDEVAVDEQSLAEHIVYPTNDDLSLDSNSTFDLGSFPSNSTVRRSNRLKRKIDYVYEDKDDSLDESSPVNRRRPKRQARKLTVPERVNIEPAIAMAAEEEEDDEVQVPLTVIVKHLKCPESGCKKKCKDKAKLNRHLWKKHQIKEFQCKVKDCTLSFASQDELKVHRKSAHRKLKNWPCAMCGKTLKGYKKMCVHLGNNHEMGRFQCSADKCDFTGKTRKRVRHHQRQHLPPKYKCTIAGCALAFNRESDLTEHLHLHNPFACGYCPKAFTSQANLTRHERIHSNLKPYHCKWPECDYSTNDSSGAYNHVRRKHFGLLMSKREQAELGIEDDRDARDFVEMTVN